MISRRNFITAGIVCAGTAAVGDTTLGGNKRNIPSYLKGYEALYAKNPRLAALTWFEEAPFGLFMHYGLYSLLEGFYHGNHSKPAEWVLKRTDIGLPEYEKLAQRFAAEKLNADFITDMALDAGMKYVDFMTVQITELLTRYGPIAAIWLDGIGTARKLPEGTLKTKELYDHIHSLQPQVLVCCKQGLPGTEDFMAHERHWTGTPTKPLEICNTTQGYSWGYDRADEGHHRGPDDVVAMLEQAKAMPANLLLNTGLRPDGSVHPDDIRTLKAVGDQLRKS